jgi:protein-L-isoaspartate(D-aspartate) O-methyltransferase
MTRPSFPAKMPAPVLGPNHVAKKAAIALATLQLKPQTKPQLKSQPSAALRPINAALKNFAVHTAAASGIGLESRAVRQRMVNKLAALGISDAAVLHAMGTVERHRFVDTALVGQAYEDTSLPIGLGQTISKPNVVARMLELLRQGAALSASQGSPKTGRVLEIGTGCGYQAALLAQLCSDVYSIERLRGLHDKARENLRPYKIAHLHLLLGDGMLGFEKGAPYAGIIAAAGGEAIPPAWVQQLAVGGRIVAPMVTSSGAQALVVLDKTPQGVTQTVLEAVHFVPLKSGVM